MEQNMVRVCAVQWKMRAYPDLKSLLDRADYFVETAIAYGADFVLLPEFFNAPLLASYSGLQPPAAIRRLAEQAPDILAHFQKSAKGHINIITGSMPELQDGALYNAGYLCHRDGRTERYEKIHVTPDESQYWDMQVGRGLRCFDTDRGRIGILICYDVEFPELGRILAAQGMEILFVPFLTDVEYGYYRVRHCAQARAIENECYVVLSGSTGNLPGIPNMDLHYAQSAVLTPSDFAFPHNAVRAEATANIETMLVADVDRNLLRDLHEKGSVKNLRDRRADLYEVVMKNNGLLEF